MTSGTFERIIVRSSEIFKIFAGTDMEEMRSVTKYLRQNTSVPKNILPNVYKYIQYHRLL